MENNDNDSNASDNDSSDGRKDTQYIMIEFRKNGEYDESCLFHIIDIDCTLYGQENKIITALKALQRGNMYKEVYFHLFFLGLIGFVPWYTKNRSRMIRKLCTIQENMYNIIDFYIVDSERSSPSCA